MLINANEEIVNQRIEVLLKEYDCCKCADCINDMMAIALNNLKPAYVNTEKGVLFKRIMNLKQQNSADIDIEILKAINMVSAHPNHDPIKEEEEETEEAASVSASPAE